MAYIVTAYTDQDLKHLVIETLAAVHRCWCRRSHCSARCMYLLVSTHMPTRMSTRAHAPVHVSLHMSTHMSVHMSDHTKVLVTEFAPLGSLHDVLGGMADDDEQASPCVMAYIVLAYIQCRFGKRRHFG